VIYYLLILKKIEDSIPYIIYDKNIAIGSTLRGVTPLNLNTLSEHSNYKTIGIALDIGWQKKKN